MQLDPILGWLPLTSFQVDGNAFRVPARRIYEKGRWTWRVESSAQAAADLSALSTGTPELLRWLRDRVE